MRNEFLKASGIISYAFYNFINTNVLTKEYTDGTRQSLAQKYEIYNPDKNQAIAVIVFRQLC